MPSIPHYRLCTDPMKGLDVEAFIRNYVDGNNDPMKDYETVKEAIKLEEDTKAAIAAQMEKMAMGGTESKKEAKRRKKEEAKRNKQEAKMLRKSRKNG